MHDGMRVAEIIREKKTLAIIAIERSQNSSPKIPGSRKNGIKTMTVVMHELRFDFWTDSVLSMIVFSEYELPNFRMFSITIIDVSTIIPIEIEMPESEKRLIVLPVIYKMMTENKMQKGIVKETINDIFMFFKNRNRIIKVMRELIIAEI